MAFPDEQAANALGLTFSTEASSGEEMLSGKREALSEAIEGLSVIVAAAEDADVQLDLADALTETAEQIRSSYSTVRFRHTGTIGTPGRAE